MFARLAEQALRKGRLMRAQVLREEGCERFPDYPTGYVILGRVYETQGLWPGLPSTRVCAWIPINPPSTDGYPGSTANWAIRHWL